MVFEDKIERGSFTGATNADVVEVSLPGMSAAMVQLTGTFIATVTFEVLVDEGSAPTWKAVTATNVTTGAAATTATAAGVYSLSVAGARRFRARCSAFTSGPVTVAVNVSRGSGGSGSGGGGGGAVTVADGANVAQGTTTDAGVVTDTSGTVIGFLRGNIIKWISQLTLMGAVNESAPASDTASSGLNGRLQRIAQRITSLIALVPAALTGSGNFKVSVAESTATVTAAGAKTNNNAAPGATNMGVLTGIANAAAPSWTEGNQVAASMDLSGNQRTLAQGLLASGATNSGVNPLLMGMNGAGALVRFLTEANAVAATTGNALLGVGPLVFDSTNWQKVAGDTSGRQIVVGPVTEGSAIVATPVFVGMSDGTNARGLRTVSAISDGSSGSSILYVGNALFNGSTYDHQRSANTDAHVVNGLAAAAQLNYNGATWDRNRNNAETTLLASAARTTTQVSAAIVTYNAGAITVILDMTAVGTGSVTLSIDGVEAVSGNLYNLLTGAAVVSNSRNVYVVDPAVPAVANVSAQKRLPRTIKITVTANNGNSATYSVSYVLQPC